MSMIDREKLIEDMNQWARDNFSMDDKFEYLLSGMEKALDIIESQPAADQWIPVAERLPNHHKNILVCLSDGYVNAGYYSFDEFKDMNSKPYEYVTAWQPLPEPYKGEEHEHD